MGYRYRHYRPQEVWLFYPDGGGKRFARCESRASAELLVRLLNDNLAALSKGEGVTAGECLDVVADEVGAINSGAE